MEWVPNSRPPSTAMSRSGCGTRFAETAMATLSATAPVTSCRSGASRTTPRRRQLVLACPAFPGFTEELAAQWVLEPTMPRPEPLALLRDVLDRVPPR